MVMKLPIPKNGGE